MKPSIIPILAILLAACGPPADPPEQPDAATESGPDGDCVRTMALRTCSSLEVGPHCPTTICERIVWYVCPEAQTEPLEPQQHGDCRWAKGSCDLIPEECQ